MLIRRKRKGRRSGRSNRLENVRRDGVKGAGGWMDRGYQGEDLVGSINIMHPVSNSIIVWVGVNIFNVSERQ